MTDSASMTGLRAAYDHALGADYRFLSYGDAGLWDLAPPGPS